MSRGSAGRAATRVVCAVTALLAVGTVLPAAGASGLTLGAFRHCPVEDPVMLEHGGGVCVYAKSGPASELGVGGALLPITRPIVLQGGTWLPVGGGTAGFVAAQGAPTLKPVAETLPGGLAGIIDPSRLSGGPLGLFDRLLLNGRSRIDMTVEMAGPASAIRFSLVNLLTGTGVALALPLKIRLYGAGGFLGPACHVGSDAAPVELELTDGSTGPPPPSEPISGRIGTPSESKAEVVTVTGNTLVENGFPLPAAEGCGTRVGWQQQIGAAIDARLGLPSPAGGNVAILESTLGAAKGTRVESVLLGRG